MMNYKNYTDQELAEAYIFPSELNEEEKKIADAELKKLRFERLYQMSDAQKQAADILRLKFQIEEYLKNGFYNQTYSFAAFLQEYIRIVSKKQIEFAFEINLHPTKLSSILTNKIDPNIALIYRLEKHSNDIIPAILWWRLWIKKIENKIVNDTEMKKREGYKVRSSLSINSLM
jgi:hypothetical protein